MRVQLLCPRCAVNPTPDPVDGGMCAACVTETAPALAADRKRIEGIATAIGCDAKDVTPAKLAEFGIDPAEATPESLAASEAQAAKAAHDEAIGAGLHAHEACRIACEVRREPGKATELLTAAVSRVVAESLAKVAEPAR